MFNNPKFIVRGWHRISGRNNTGRITIRHRGGGIKRKVYFIDFFRESGFNEKFTVRSIIWRINKSSLLLLQSSLLKSSLIICVSGLSVGDSVYNYIATGGAVTAPPILVGSSYVLRDFPIGSSICCLESNSKSGSSLIRSIGCSGTVVHVSFDSILVKLPSGQISQFSPNCRATLGEISSEFKEFKVYKAGHTRFLGFRPSVRGVAMNAADHPHGGGEGKSRIGRIPVSPWGFKVKQKKL